MGFRANLLSFLVLSSCLLLNVFASFDLDHLISLAPHTAPSLPPVAAPAPHHHHHHHKGPGGHHHHKPPTVPPVHPPTKPPVHPPVKAPVHPPVKAPVHPPVKAPVHPPVKAPVHPPVKAPVHPPVKSPVHPPVKAPVHPPVKAPVHPPVKAPVHPPVKAPVHPPVKAPVHPPVKAPVHPPVKAPVHPPVKAPVHPPVVAPVHPPTKAPVHPPVPLPVRRKVAIRGVVYCKACKYKGVDTLLGATPLEGAKVLLTCKNTKYPLRLNATTDKNGFFFITPPKTLTTYGVHKCIVTLLKSPKATCNHPTNLHYGVKGAPLIPTPKPIGSKLPTPPLPYDVYTVGPFAYEASKKTVCPHA